MKFCYKYKYKLNNLLSNLLCFLIQQKIFKRSVLFIYTSSTSKLGIEPYLNLKQTKSYVIRGVYVYLCVLCIFNKTF